jgi:hypothetical protein
MNPQPNTQESRIQNYKNTTPKNPEADVDHSIAGGAANLV